MRRYTRVLEAACVCALAAGGQLQLGQSAFAGNAVGTSNEWLSYGGDSDETGFSRLNRINVANVSELGLAWFLDLPGEASLEATPLAVNGVIYFTGTYAAVYAAKATSGKLIWKYDPKTWEHNPDKMHYGFAVNRGSAYASGKIFSASIDGRLFALDASTGALLWSVETTAPGSAYTVTGAPRVFNGKVIIGNGSADFGARGYVTAYDQKSGRQVWRFYVVPGSPEENKGDSAMERAASTWNGEFWKQGTGGGPWDNITFDAEFNRIYVGTANAAPYDPEVRSPGGGDNLYTASIVALNADTGKYVWHYQINPRDSWDYDCTQQITLADLKIDGTVRKVLMQAPKNGFFYVIDRTSGKLISAEKLGKVTWAAGIDLATGRPMEAKNIRYETGESVVWPSMAGAHSWMRQSYSPLTGLIYIPYMQLGIRFTRGAAEGEGTYAAGLNFMGHRESDADGKGALIAWDPLIQKARWRIGHETIWNGGTLATAGNLVFQGTADGQFTAYDATTGKRLWQSFAGMGIIAAPITYSVDGKQYVSILAGYGGAASFWGDVMNVGWKYSGPRRLLTFALKGNAKLAFAEAPTLAVRAVDDPGVKLETADVAAGKMLYIACGACHGLQLVAAGGPAPDLRESTIALNPAAFRSVVKAGALISKGMPRFDSFSDEQVEQIRTYIRFGAREVLAKQSRQ